jgi:hypothetical protein
VVVTGGSVVVVVLVLVAVLVLVVVVVLVLVVVVPVEGVPTRMLPPPSEAMHSEADGHERLWKA